MNNQATNQEQAWNLFARTLQSILAKHGYGLGHLDDRAGIHPEKVRRLQRSLKIPKSFPVLNIEEMEQTNLAFHFTYREKVRLRAALLATSIEETLMDRIEPRDALRAAEEILPIIEQALLAHSDDLAGIGAIKGQESEEAGETEIDQKLGGALVLIDRATLALHLSRNTDSQAERIDRVRQAEAGFTSALTQLQATEAHLKTSEAWQAWFNEARKGLETAQKALIGLGARSTL